jgi:hypothetical protein
MEKRKSLTKKIRFEVFKRDSFKCQYCGKSSPDVILEVDHIVPVAEGGGNEMINLITACFDCNRGKGKRKIVKSNDIMKLEKMEFEKLKLQKEQMDLYVEWKKELLNVNLNEFEKLNELFSTTGKCWNELGKKSIIKLIKKHGFQECYESLEIVIDNGKEGNTLEQLTKIINSRKLEKEKPYLKDVYYIRAIVRNRMNCNEWQAKQIIEDAILAGYYVEDIKKVAAIARNWTHWKELMKGFE